MNERIQAIIKAVGLKKIEFSKRIRLSAPYISELCSGKTYPSDRTITDICREFNVNEEWLRTGKGEMFCNVSDTSLKQIVSEYDLDELDQRIIMGYLRLNASDRATIKRLLNSIVPPAPTGQEQTETDLTTQVAKLARQNQELAAEIAAIKEEDAAMEAAAELSVWSSALDGSLSPAEQPKK